MPFVQLNSTKLCLPATGVISVDTIRQERVGDVQNNGRDWHSHGEEEQVRVNDVPFAGRGRATPLVSPTRFAPLAGSRWTSVGHLDSAPLIPVQARVCAATSLLCSPA